MAEFRMPSLGADMEAGTLLEWRIKPGDRVHKGDIVAVVDTDKAAIEIEVFTDGVVEDLLVPEGAKVPVGTLLARLRDDGRVVATATPDVPPPAPAAAPQTAVLRPESARPASAPTRATPPTPDQEPAGPASARVRASPAARWLARARGVDLEHLVGSGPSGAILREDVEHAAAAAPRSIGSAEPSGAAMRRAIATAMSRSKREIPHYYLSTQICLQRAQVWLQDRNAARPVFDRLLPAVLWIKAVARACRAVPEMNGHYLEDRFVPSAAVQLGFAIALRGGGLLNPAIAEPDTRPLDELMQALRDLVERARVGRLRSSELGGQTITLTSLGERGADTAFAVVHPPQVAIVSFGKIAERAWPVGDKILGVPTVYASLAADHRVSDGHRGALFLDAIDRALQDPEELQ